MGEMKPGEDYNTRGKQKSNKAPKDTKNMGFTYMTREQIDRIRESRKNPGHPFINLNKGRYDFRKKKMIDRLH